MVLKKIAVLVFFGAVITGLYFTKKHLVTKTSNSEFIIFNWRITPNPARLNSSLDLTIHLKDHQNQPISNAKVNIEANMSHPGMVPQLFEAKAFENGFYKIHFIPTMAGDWLLFVTIKEASGRVIKEEIPFNVPAAK